MTGGSPDDSATRFALVGCTNFVVSFTVFYLSFNYLPPDAVAALARSVGASEAALHPPAAAVANVLAYLAGMVNSFVLNRSWTFRAGGSALPQALRFAAVSALQPHDGHDSVVRARRRPALSVSCGLGTGHRRRDARELLRLQALGVRTVRAREPRPMTRADRGARLIVHADDFGLSEAVNRAVIAAHENGIVTAASLMAGGDAFEHAVALAKDHPTLDVGVHLTLTEQHPTAPAADVPSLVGPDGKFAPHAFQFAKRYLRGDIALTHVRAELDAQIRRVVDHGLVPSHLDGHQHVHVLPGIARIVAELAGAYGIRAVRCPAERLRGYMLKDLARTRSASSSSSRSRA